MRLSINEVRDSKRQTARPIPRKTTPWKHIGVYIPGKQDDVEGRLRCFDVECVGAQWDCEGFFDLFTV